MKETETSGEFVTALARGLDVIQAFSSERPEMTLSEVAAHTGLNAATVRRSLHTLMALGYVKQDRKQFVLTAKVLQLGAAFVQSMNLNQVAQIYLQVVADEFHDASSLTVLDGNDVVYIVHIPSNRPARLRQFVGARMPAHAASTGYVLLAHERPEQIKQYLSQVPFPEFTPYTPIQKDQLLAKFAEAKVQGYCIAQDAIAVGSIAIAVPVSDAQGNVVAAINCSADSTRVDRETLIKTRLPHLQRAARQISEQLARFPALVNSIKA